VEAGRGFCGHATADVLVPCLNLIAGFLDRVRIELRLQGQLQGLGLKPGLVQQLLMQRSTSNAELNELRLDLSSMKQVRHATSVWVCGGLSHSCLDSSCSQLQGLWQLTFFGCVETNLRDRIGLWCQADSYHG